MIRDKLDLFSLNHECNKLLFVAHNKKVFKIRDFTTLFDLIFSRQNLERFYNYKNMK